MARWRRTSSDRLAGSAGAVALVCPGCGAEHPADDRFCEACALPLVHAGETGSREVGSLASDPLRSAARKVDPRYTEGEPVKVIGTRNQAEGEFIQNLLLEEGVPSMLRRARGFDVPDFLASGPRDVLVPEAGLAAAREVLLQSELLDQSAPPAPAIVAEWRLLVFLLGGFALVAVIVLIAIAIGL